MVEFTPDPAADKLGATLRVVRVSGDRPLRGIITSETWVGCYTHFAGGRTVPCEQQACSLCSSGTPPRWHAYLALILHPTHEHVLACLPLSAYSSLKTYHQEWTTIRGAMLQACRPSKRPNGRVLTSLDHAGKAPHLLPAAPLVEAILLRMWQSTPNLKSARPSRSDRKRSPPGEPPEVRLAN